MDTKKSYAPVVVFVYNRRDKAEKTLESLNSNVLATESDLYIFSDGPKHDDDIKKVSEVRTFLKEFKDHSSFKSINIIESPNNKGLAMSVIDGVSNVISRYGKVIVIEDDLICVKNLLNFMNDCLEYYKDNKKIWSISGYTYPLKSMGKYEHDVYYTYRGSSWGWATWNDRWKTIDWSMNYYNKLRFSFKDRMKLKKAGTDLFQMMSYQFKGKIDSWAVRWVYNQTQNEMFTVYPSKTFIYNIGLDGSGTHKVNEKNDSYNNLDGHSYHLEKVDFNNIVNKDFLSHFKEPIKNKLKGIMTFPYRKIRGLFSFDKI